MPARSKKGLNAAGEHASQLALDSTLLSIRASVGLLMNAVSTSTDGLHRLEHREPGLLHPTCSSRRSVVRWFSSVSANNGSVKGRRALHVVEDVDQRVLGL